MDGFKKSTYKTPKKTETKKQREARIAKMSVSEKLEYIREAFKKLKIKLG